MNAAAYVLEPIESLSDEGTGQIRRIYEDGFAPHLRAEFSSLTTGREAGESALALVRDGRPCGFAVLRPLGGTGWMFLRYFVAGQRGQGLGGIMWDRLMAWLRTGGCSLLIWDVEDPDEPGCGPAEVEIRNRRIRFYERHGGRLLPVRGYGNPHGDDWTPMRLMAAPAPGSTERPGTPTVLSAVYQYRWRLEPSDPRVTATRVTGEQKGQ